MKKRALLFLPFFITVLAGCGPSGPQDKHVHHFEWGHDNTYHWQLCMECGEVKNREEHHVEDWEEKQAATEEHGGVYEGECTICHFTVRKETQPLQHVHNHDGGVFDTETQHYYVCSVDGQEVDFEDHRYGAWSEVYPPTYTSEGLEERFCEVCYHRQTRYTDVIPHEHNFVMVYSEYYHHLECSICHETDGSYQSHDLYEVSRTEPATVFGKPTITEKCHDCDYTKTYQGNPILSVEYDDDLEGYVISRLNYYDTKKITIPSSYNDEPIVAIGEGAFYQSNIVEVTIPDTVKEIRSSAFASCDRLVKVNFTNGSELTTIGASAFYNCKELSYLPSEKLYNLTKVESTAFAYSGILSFKIPASCANDAFTGSRIYLIIDTNGGTQYSYTSYDYDAYVTAYPGYGGNTHVFYEDGFVFGVHNKLVKLIGVYLTDGNKRLTLPTIDKLINTSGTVGYDVSYYTIRKHAIYAENLEEFIMSDQVIEVEMDYIEYPYNITYSEISKCISTDLELSGRGTTIYRSQFSVPGYGDYQIADNNIFLTQTSYAVYNKDFTKLVKLNKGITNFVVPNTVKTIGGSAFENTDVVEVTLPDNCVCEDSAFLYASELTTVNNLHNFSNSIFHGCPKLTTINLAPDFNPICDYNPFDENSSMITNENGLYYFGKNEEQHYYLVDVEEDLGSDGTVVIPSDTKYIAENALNNISSDARTIYAPIATCGENEDTVLKVFEYKNITKFVFNNPNTKRIGNKAFFACDYLAEVVFPENLEEIGDKAFSTDFLNAVSEGITIPDSVKKIGSSNYLPLTRLPNSLEFVKAGAVSDRYLGDNKVVEDNYVYYSSGVNKYHYLIGFQDSSNDKIPENIVINNNTKIVGTDVFFGNPETVTLPENLVTIGYFDSMPSSIAVTTHKGFNYVGSTSNPYMFLTGRDPDFEGTYEIHEDCKIVAGTAIDSYVKNIYLEIPNSVTQLTGTLRNKSCMYEFGTGLNYIGASTASMSRAIINHSNFSDSEIGAYATVYINKSENPYSFVGGEVFYKGLRADKLTLDLATAIKWTEAGISVQNYVLGAEEFYWDGTIKDWIDFVAYLGRGAQFFQFNDFYYKDSEVYKLLDNVVLPEGIKYIPEYAFNKMLCLESVKTNSDLLLIEQFAFQNCSKLKTVELNEGLLRIDQGAFALSPVEIIVIPNSVTFVSQWAFTDARNLKVVVIGESLYTDAKLIGYTTENFTCFINMSPFALVKSDGSPNYDWYYSSVDKDIYIEDDGSYSIKIEIDEEDYYNLLFVNNFSDDVSVTTQRVEAITGGYLTGNFSKLRLTSYIEYIGEGAFVNCQNLETIYFDGTTTEWASVVGDRDWASGSNVTQIICSDSTIVL